MDESKLIKLIREGESDRVEFKESAKDVDKEIVAFANANGGYLIIGISDNGEVVGVTKKDEEKINSVIQNIRPKPEMKISKVTINKKKLIVIEIKKSNKLVFLGKVAYIRIGRGIRPLELEEIVQRASEIVQFYFDEQVTNIDVKEINKEYFNFYLKKRKEIRNISPVNDFIKDLIKSKAIVKKGKKYYLRFAALLFFTTDPQKFYDYTKVKIIGIDEENNVLWEKEFTGPIWKQVDEIEKFFLSNIKKVKFFVGWERKEMYEYPLKALREAVTNALIHRNYAIPTEVKIFIYPNKIVIRNPGSFPPGVNENYPEHIPRNKLLCKYMYDIGYIEKYGIGIELIKSEVKKHPLVKVEFLIFPNKVEVVFEKVYDKVLDEEDKKIIEVIKRFGKVNSSKIAKEIKKSKVTVVKKLNKLIELGIVKKEGKGPITLYSIVK